MNQECNLIVGECIVRISLVVVDHFRTERSSISVLIREYSWRFAEFSGNISRIANAALIQRKQRINWLRLDYSKAHND